MPQAKRSGDEQDGVEVRVPGEEIAVDGEIAHYGDRGERRPEALAVERDGVGELEGAGVDDRVLGGGVFEHAAYGGREFAPAFHQSSSFMGTTSVPRAAVRRNRASRIAQGKAVFCLDTRRQAAAPLTAPRIRAVN